MISPLLVAIALAAGLLALLPTARLRTAGLGPRALGAYWLGMVALGVLALEQRGPARIVIPVLVVAYVAPFVAARVANPRRIRRIGRRR